MAGNPGLNPRATRRRSASFEKSGISNPRTDDWKLTTRRTGEAMTTQSKIDLNTVRADHTGALKRPDWLLELYARLGEGTATQEEVAEAQDKAVREVLKKQEDIGLHVITDGEYCRIGGFQESFGGAVTGFDSMPYVYRRRTGNPAAASSSGTNANASSRI